MIRVFKHYVSHAVIVLGFVDLALLLLAGELAWDLRIYQIGMGAQPFGERFGAILAFAVIVMTAPILLPLITQVGFDPYWFAVVLTINMEIGLITPPVGLNLYVINGIAPDVGLPKILAGALPFVLLMVVGILLLCVFPQIATWLPDLLMGAGN